MIRVAVPGETGLAEANVLNDFDVTGGEIKYYSLCCEELGKIKLFGIIKLIARFLRDIRKYDVLFQVYVGRASYIYVPLAKLFGVPVISHWIGTDVYNLLYKGWWNPWINLFSIHLAQSPRLKEELAQKGIDAKVLRIDPGNLSLDIAGMPERHAVLMYMPEGREVFYGYDTITQVIERYSELDFYIVANSNKDMFPQPNVKLMGWLSGDEMDSLHEKISILLRYVIHDGWSRMITEGLFKGKEIIFNFCEIPYTRRAVNFEQICAEMDDILSRPPEVRYDARKYAMENHLPQISSQKMADEIRKLLRV